ncbi:MAG: alanine racemase, partial [Chthoniobacteraceae bacterium]
MSTSPTTDAAANENWWRVRNEGEIPTPALLVFRERVNANIARMIEIAGSPDRLRPHVKTHKLGPLVRAQVAAGITKFKCATIAEAAMTAEAGAKDVLLAYPAVGPAASHLVKLQAGFLEVAFSAIVDSSYAAAVLSREATEAGVTIGVYLDVDCGMHRTGIEPGNE